jgi:antitoxin YefM
MRVLSYTEFRASLAETWDHVIGDCEEAVVTRAGHPSVVVVAESEWRSIQETLYLLRDPEQARRMLDSIDQARRGDVETHELIEPDDEEKLHASRVGGVSDLADGGRPGKSSAA